MFETLSHLMRLNVRFCVLPLALGKPFVTELARLENMKILLLLNYEWTVSRYVIVLAIELSLIIR